MREMILALRKCGFYADLFRDKTISCTNRAVGGSVDVQRSCLALYIHKDASTFTFVLDLTENTTASRQMPELRSILYCEWFQIRTETG